MQFPVARRFSPAALVLAFVDLACGQSRTQHDVLALEQPGNQWIESALTGVAMSNDGHLALFGSLLSGSPHLYSLPAGHEEASILGGGLDRVNYAVFCGARAALARNGRRGSQEGWFLPGGSEQVSNLPRGALLVCSVDGNKIAYADTRAAPGGLFIRIGGKDHPYRVEGTLTSMIISRDGEMLYCLTSAPNGESSLSRIQIRTGESQIIATRLDANLMRDSIAVSPDGKRVYVPLASDGAPDNEARHKPDADRWLKIYEINVATGVRRRIVESPGQDNNNPSIADGKLSWARTVLQHSIVTIPSIGGPAKEVVAGGELPMWNPDGSKIGYFFGDWRFADWALDLDDGVVGVDANGNRTSEPAVIVSGYHEDFPPAWSPNGKWIAFHSHRSPKAVPNYYSPGSTDDVYLRRAGDSRAPEIRLTDFGWETGPAYWSPDGRKLLFVSWQRGGKPGVGKIWVITLDTERGAALKTEMLALPKEIRSVGWAMWSPDGNEIGIEDEREPGKLRLWVVRSDGSHPEKLLDYEGTVYGGIDWRRDGRAIIYSAIAGTGLQLFEEPRSGGAARQLTHDSGNLMHPRVSPDGRRIACTRIVQSKQLWYRQMP